MQNSVIERALIAFVDCYVIHNDNSYKILYGFDCFLMNRTIFDSNQIKPSFGELKKTIRECIHSFVVISCLQVYDSVLKLFTLFFYFVCRYDSDRIKNPISEAAVNCICKGFVDGVKHSCMKDTLTNDRLYLLFERLKNHLYYEICSQQVDLIRILSVLITQISFKDVFLFVFV